LPPHQDWVRKCQEKKSSSVSRMITFTRGD
jgi:hypothetical protein